MSETIETNVLVLGGGPGGYVAAIRSGQLGLETVLVEAGALGGTCLNRGCIPSKALIHAAGVFAEMRRVVDHPHMGLSLTAPSVDLAGTVAWKDDIVGKLNGGVATLLKRAKVRVVTGWGAFTDAKTCRVKTANGEATVKAQHVILATGSVPVEIPALPFGGKVMSSAELLALDHLPQRLAVVGGGYIGLELGTAFAKLGSKVTVVEAIDRILPQYDKALTEPVARWLTENGVTVHTGARALGEDGDGLAIEINSQKSVIPADAILVTVGRKPLTADWGLENMALAMDGPFIKVDDTCATATRNVWAIGDLVGEPLLAHKASAQGEMVAEIIAGKRRRFDPAAIPAICFTEPEIVQVGKGPDETGTITGMFPYAANGRALSMDAGEDGGFVRVVADEGTHRIVGVQAVGAHVSELSAAFTQAIEMGSLLEDIAGIIHAHPTLGEAFHEAALKALGHAIHI